MSTVPGHPHCRECLPQRALTVGPSHGAQVPAYMPHGTLNAQLMDLCEGMNAGLFQALYDAGANARRGQQNGSFIGGKARLCGLSVEADGEVAEHVVWQEVRPAHT
jgi:hypothetical protein